ncbi:MAG: redoxin family protein [Sulfuricellaceae bacterium]
MKKSLAALCLGLMLASVTAWAGVAADAPAPGFSAPHLLKPSMMKLDDYRGRVVYVDFWASWCPSCRSAFPKIDRIYAKYRERGFDVVAVNQDQELGEALRFAEQQPISFTLVTDRDHSIAERYGVKAMPSAYLIDRKGVVRHIHRGYKQDSAAALEKQIVALLEEKP